MNSLIDHYDTFGPAGLILQQMKGSGHSGRTGPYDQNVDGFVLLHCGLPQNKMSGVSAGQVSLALSAKGR
jgi:hypothetical protein